MKLKQTAALDPPLQAQCAVPGQALARLRIARGVTQHEAAIRAGISRNSAWRIEHGDAGVALGQIVRYLNAIAPGKSLLSLLQEDDPALRALAQKERRSRARGLSPEKLAELDF